MALPAAELKATYLPSDDHTGVLEPGHPHGSNLFARRAAFPVFTTLGAGGERRHLRGLDRREAGAAELEAHSSRGFQLRISEVLLAEKAGAPASRCAAGHGFIAPLFHFRHRGRGA